ncbi:hypothetical protein MRS44_017147 [Fusarium solani]|uniref:uncharacterized protein n=1 Tax=Fusarium solani TaxID=169388 RepID=UPI0032C4553E|nr:hypothetical protein MRS44_017147 [Fusarium solani]
MHLSPQSQASIRAALDSITSSSTTTGIPGLVFACVSKHGSLFSHASGMTGLSRPKSMTLDTTFWLASCTKLITTIACMQLVEQSKLSLDDAAQVERLCPELAQKKVLSQNEGELVLAEKKDKITLRMLLTHTAGFGYSFLNETPRDWGRPVGVDEFSGEAGDVLGLPLVRESGEAWEEGRHIFTPLGIDHISMFPGAEMRSNMASMLQRDGAGKVTERDHLYRRPLRAETDEERDGIFNSGGAGCFGAVRDYCQILSTLLNNGISPTTQQPLLRSTSITEILTNQIPDRPNFGRRNIAAAKPELTNAFEELLPQEGDPPQGFGLSCMLTNLSAGSPEDEKAQRRGRKDVKGSKGRNVASWAGLANQFWWLDVERGVAGMLAAQVLPFGDEVVMGVYESVERGVYDGLED